MAVASKVFEKKSVAFSEGGQGWAPLSVAKGDSNDQKQTQDTVNTTISSGQLITTSPKNV